MHNLDTLSSISLPRFGRLVTAVEFLSSSSLVVAALSSNHALERDLIVYDVDGCCVQRSGAVPALRACEGARVCGLLPSEDNRLLFWAHELMGSLSLERNLLMHGGVEESGGVFCEESEGATGAVGGAKAAGVKLSSGMRFLLGFLPLRSPSSRLALRVTEGTVRELLPAPFVRRQYAKG